MRVRFRSLAVAAIVVAAPAAAQMFQAPGWVTVNVAGLGNTTTVAGESRIPILPRDVAYDTGTGLLHLRATGHRGAVRQLDIDVRGARTAQAYEFSANAASLRVLLDTGTALTATAGHGNVTLTAVDANQVTGTYEGTFSSGAVPVVIRGRFLANFPHARGDGGASHSP